MIAGDEVFLFVLAGTMSLLFTLLSAHFRMAERLMEYRASTLNDILAAKKFLEAIVNSIHEPIIGLNRQHEILFINNEALTVLNLKREEVIRCSAEELSLKNDLLRRLVRELAVAGG